MAAIGKSISGCLLLLLLFLVPATAPAQKGWAEISPCVDKRVIGQECWVHIAEMKMNFLARVDTGATTTSLHATDYYITGGTDDPRNNIGRIINFLTVSADGQSHRMEAEIAGVQTVVNAFGREKRYLVRLTLTANGVTKTILINLRDRSKMKYKLLIGRDWLADDFLVDVSLDTSFTAEEGEEQGGSALLIPCISGSPAF